MRITLESDVTRILEWITQVFAFNTSISPIDMMLLISCLECCEYGQVYSLIPICSITLHHQLSAFTAFIVLESESTITHFNWFQYFQIYSLIGMNISHSWEQHVNNTRMHLYQPWVLWENASLVITHCEWEYPSTLTKRSRSCSFQSSHSPICSFQST